MSYIKVNSDAWVSFVGRGVDNGQKGHCDCGVHVGRAIVFARVGFRSVYGVVSRESTQGSIACCILNGVCRCLISSHCVNTCLWALSQHRLS